MNINQPPGHKPKIMLHTIEPLDSTKGCGLPYGQQDLREAYSELTETLNSRGLCAHHALLLLAHELQQEGWQHSTGPVDPTAN